MTEINPARKTRITDSCSRIYSDIEIIGNVVVRSLYDLQRFRAVTSNLSPPIKQRFSFDQTLLHQQISSQ